MSKASLSFQYAATAALDNPEALARLQAIWQANVQQMAEYVRKHHWTVTQEPLPPVGLTAPQLDALEARLGEPLPPQLRWALGWAGAWQFGWSCAEDEEFEDCYGGRLQWSAQQLAEEDLRAQMEDWVEYQNTLLEDVEEQPFLDAHRALWQAHFPFAVMPNGDLLTIDTRNPDPQRQPVRYYFHDLDGDSTEGALLAPDFFSFISAWTALGCVGSDWGTWLNFVSADGGFAVQGKYARKWLKWLAQDPNKHPADTPPKRVAARTDADRALLLAAQAGDVQALRQALAQGAHPDAEDLADLLSPGMFDGFSKGDTALVLAARQNRLDMLEVLLQAGASLATRDLPLSRLLNGNGYEGRANAQTLLWLIERGARIDPWPNERSNALHELFGSSLSRQEFERLRDAMLARGCNLDVRDAQGRTLLMQAGPINQRILLAAGANAHLRDHDGMTAMHYVRSAEQPALLQAQGLDINDLSQPQDPKEATRPLHRLLSRHWAKEPAELAALVQTLLEQGANPSLPDGAGNNAWSHCRHAECAEVLNKHLTFDPAQSDGHGRSLLHWRARDGYLEPHERALVVWYVQHGLNVNAQDNNGETALHYLVRYYNRIADADSTLEKNLGKLAGLEWARSLGDGLADFMQNLLKRKKDSAPEDEDAADINLLLALGARWDIPNRKGQTPAQRLKPNLRKRWPQ